MIKTMFGRKWRFRELNAILAKQVLDSKESADVLCSIDAIEPSTGAWAPLDSEDAINRFVESWEWLSALEEEARQVNFGFLNDWKPIRLPQKMVANGVQTMQFRSIDPIFGSLIVEKLATLNELRTVYSLRDAFTLLDCLTIKKANDFLKLETD